MSDFIDTPRAAFASADESGSASPVEPTEQGGTALEAIALSPVLRTAITDIRSQLVDLLDHLTD